MFVVFRALMFTCSHMFAPAGPAGEPSQSTREVKPSLPRQPLAQAEKDHATSDSVDSQTTRSQRRHRSNQTDRPTTRDSGAVDGCHIPMPTPSQNEHACVNRQHTHSINLMRACVMMLDVFWMYVSDGQGQFMIQEYLKTAFSPRP